MAKLKYIKNKVKKVESFLSSFQKMEAEKAAKFHEGFPEYKITPLVELKYLAKELGVKSIYIKDESYRFGQNAFKVLGSSYAVAKYVAEKLKINPEELNYDRLTSPEIHEALGELTFISATDGNHGRGLAWTANRLNQNCVIYMPKGSAKERLEHIKELGATVCITEYNYDDTVRLAKKHAKKYGWILIQDTTLEGYEKIPTWIMQGYLTMMKEVMDQLGDRKPTHVILQAGVGAMAGSMTGYLASYYGNEKPIITIVEPDHADCIFETAKAGDGTLHTVKGELSTIMAGLACGEPCSIGWNMLRRYADYFVSMEDEVAAKGMRILGNPVKGDTRIISGESGAAGFGFLMELLRNERWSDWKNELKLDEQSVILCINTEGDTDKVNYRKIVWDGQ